MRPIGRDDPDGAVNTPHLDPLPQGERKKKETARDGDDGLISTVAPVDVRGVEMMSAAALDMLAELRAEPRAEI